MLRFFQFLLGYFAYEKSIKTGECDIVSYSIKRYIYFVTCGLFINSLYKISDIRTRGYITSFDFFHWLKVSFCLGDEIYPTFWCLKTFFLASVIAYALGVYGMRVKEKVLVCLIAIIMGRVWLAICLFGTFVPDVLSKRHKYEKRLQFFLLIFILLFSRGNESSFTYIRYGITILAIIIFINMNKYVQVILNNKIISEIGRASMGVFMLHLIIYTHVGPVLFKMLESLEYDHGFAINLILTFVVIVAVSLPIDFIIKKVVIAQYRFLQFLESLILRQTEKIK